MKIYLTPSSAATQLFASVVGDVITLNDSVFDFSSLPEGAELPIGAVDSKWIVGRVYRDGGEIHLTLILPHGPNAPHETRFPAALYEPLVVTDGLVPLPHYDAEPDVEIVSPLDEEPEVTS